MRPFTSLEVTYLALEVDIFIPKRIIFAAELRILFPQLIAHMELLVLHFLEPVQLDLVVLVLLLGLLIQILDHTLFLRNYLLVVLHLLLLLELFCIICAASGLRSATSSTPLLARVAQQTDSIGSLFKFADHRIVRMIAYAAVLRLLRAVIVAVLALGLRAGGQSNLLKLFFKAVD